MTKIIALNGDKYSKKDIVALKLAKNSSVEYVRPYSTKNDVDFNFATEDAMLKMFDEKTPLLFFHLNGEIFAYFKEQFVADYCVVIVDDFSLISLKNAWDGDFMSVKIVNEKSEKSERYGVYDLDYDIVFDVDVDDIHMLEAQLE